MSNAKQRKLQHKKETEDITKSAEKKAQEKEAKIQDREKKDRRCGKCLIMFGALLALLAGLGWSRQQYSAHDDVRPGKQLREAGLRPKHPAVIVPGFVTSGLELWAGQECAQKYFRERIWGSLTMTQSFLTNSSCWFEHMQLDMESGMDPVDSTIKLRAAEGLEAVDFFFPGYHVWAKLIESLADLGYDSGNVVGVTYDWRLAVPLLEQRDGYFTKLKAAIEGAHKLHKEKPVVMAHSWGDNVFRNFMRWAENEESGWCEKHLEAYVNIAGPVLGVPKSVSACLSGEMRDTAQLGSLAGVMTEHWMPRHTRAKLFRSWGSLIGMLPVGGPAIWGNRTWAPDDTAEMRTHDESHGAFFSRKEGPYQRKINPAALLRPQLYTDTFDAVLSKLKVKMRKERKQKFLDKDVELLTIDEAHDILLDVGGEQFKHNIQRWGAIHTEPCSSSGAKKCPELEFLNPLRDPLPKAPSMKMFCMYGVGAPAERSYHYQHVSQPQELDKGDQKEAKGEANREDMLWRVNTEVHAPDIGVERGVRTSDGDGTVPVISTGLMCYKGWRGTKLNPSNIPIVSREYKHQPTNAFKDLRGGPRASSHVEALANVELMEDVLKIVAGMGHTLKDDITSDIAAIAEQVTCFDDNSC